MILAAMEGALSEVKKLVEEGADVNEKDANGFTALHIAVATDPEMAKYIEYLKVENQILTEQSEDILLLSLVAEAVADKNSEEEIIGTILERASILKELDYACFAEIDGCIVKALQDYSILFENSRAPVITLPQTAVNDLSSQSVSVVVGGDNYRY